MLLCSQSIIPTYIFADTHVDDSEITLNVCLGKQFTGGKMYFIGRRCENHVYSGTDHQVLYLRRNISNRLSMHTFILSVIFASVTKTDFLSTSLL
jgi:hypothetical protein